MPGEHTYADLAKYDQEQYGTLSQIFDEASTEQYKNNVWLNLFNSNLASQAKMTERYLAQGQSGGAKRIAEGAQRVKSEAIKPLEKFYKSSHVTDSYEVTIEHVHFFMDNYAHLEKQPKLLAKNLWEDIDGDCGSVLDNAWSTTRVDVLGNGVATLDNTCVDGAAIISEAHIWTPGGTDTYSNLIATSTHKNPLPTIASIQRALTQGRTFRNSRGVIKPVKFDSVLCSANLEFLFEEIMFSKLRAGEDTNTVTRIGNLKKLVVGDGLADGKWFLYDSTMMDEVFEIEFSKLPTLNPVNLIDRYFLSEYVADAFYKLMIKQPQYIFGSNSSNTVIS